MGRVTRGKLIELRDYAIERQIEALVMEEKADVKGIAAAREQAYQDMRIRLDDLLR